LVLREHQETAAPEVQGRRTLLEERRIQFQVAEVLVVMA
tara:strand:+ start:1826 stop:1942 length:117 start_codon:yes stop_codon:yes gene_type:complete